MEKGFQGWLERMKVRRITRSSDDRKDMGKVEKELRRERAECGMQRGKKMLEDKTGKNIG